MHNLGVVVRYEVVRTLKKKTFWIMALSFPVIAGLLFGIIYFSNKTTEQQAEDTKNQKFSFVVTDEASIVNDDLIRQLGGSETNSRKGAIQDVKSGKIDAYFYYPKDISTTNVEIYAQDVGLFDNSRYEGVAKLLLQQSVEPRVDPEVVAVLRDKVSFNAITYKEGVVSDGFKELIAPGIFLVLFYFLIALFGNQMLTSTTEEKENRVIEMILTTIEAKTLIVGKILSLLLLAFLQIIVILTPIVIAYIFLRETLSLPSLDISSIPIDPGRIVVAAAIFLFSFIMFTGLLVAIGAAVPTAKEAAGFFGAVMAFIFGPLYAAPLFISAPDTIFVQVLSFFPLTAPIPLLLRNAVGNLSTVEAAAGIAVLAVGSIIIMTVAVRLFQYGALEYTNRVSLKVLFGSNSKSP